MLDYQEKLDLLLERAQGCSILFQICSVREEPAFTGEERTTDLRCSDFITKPSSGLIMSCQHVQLLLQHVSGICLSDLARLIYIS